jgi:hypothetical protein
MRLKRIACCALFAVALLDVTGTAAGESVRLGPVDTTPPEPDFTPRLRQDMEWVFRHGILGTCRTVDNETPVDCRLVALRKGRRLSARRVSIRPPYYGYAIDLPISRPDRRRLRRVSPPVMVKLRLTVTDPAGNHATVAKRIELCRKERCFTHGGR